ncbi:hypothetical protein SAM23877_1674 [Streptomyces ambofaciens ATCC 23877]|uniref:Uncharacterized protein n=1 Tax=Streptomyces ambofaciens (strain ATCC 23877 / 3486 / DSM 40053 / JCM 4204 / NBRC 12836 / NRRL B-2516) TaxID=278992 RepID=A0A0K2ANZ4_STRA7|nr:hypothetical protein SAM23877_1674 [Streptomyces ambofaciens ATCC 23877]
MRHRRTDHSEGWARRAPSGGAPAHPSGRVRAGHRKDLDNHGAPPPALASVHRGRSGWREHGGPPAP